MSKPPAAAPRKTESPDHSVKVGGRNLILRFSLRATLCLKDYWGFEDDPDMTADGAKTAEEKVQARMAKPSMDDFVTIFWAATRSKQPDLTREDVLELLDEGGLEGMGELLEQVTSGASPRSDGKKKPTTPTTSR